VAIDEPGAGQRQGHHLILGDVGRASHDPQPVLAGVDGGQHEPVGVGVRLDRLDPADVDLVPAIADNGDLLRFETSHSEPVGQFGRRQSGLDEFLQPPDWNFHQPNPRSCGA
jgi:hypothetical protein